MPLCERLNRRFTGYVDLNALSSVHSKTPFPRFPHNVLQTPPTQEIPTLNTSPKTKCRSYAPQRGAPGAAGLSRAETIVPRQRYAPTHRTDDETPHLMHSERSNAVLAPPYGCADTPRHAPRQSSGFPKGPPPLWSFRKEGSLREKTQSKGFSSLSVSFGYFSARAEKYLAEGTQHLRRCRPPTSCSSP